MKRLNVPKEYEHLFDGSKLFCDFTDEEKKVYKEKMMQKKKPFYEKYSTRNARKGKSLGKYVRDEIYEATECA